MTLADVISEARKLVNDTDSTAYRYTDVNLVGVGNQVIRRVLNLRPDIFAVLGTVLCTTGEIYQSAPADSFRLIDVIRIQSGNAVAEVDRDMLNTSSPEWATYPAGPATEWMRHPRSPNKFFIFPPAPVNQTLVVEYAQVPSVYVIADPIVIPDSYLPVLIDGVVWLAESIDDEHVNSQRAQMFMQSFMTGLGITLQSRVITDTEDAGMSQQPPAKAA